MCGTTTSDLAKLIDAELANWTDLVQRQPQINAIGVVRVKAGQRLDLLTDLKAAATYQTTTDNSDTGHVSDGIITSRGGQRRTQERHDHRAPLLR